MGGWYPPADPRPSFNFFGSGAPEVAAHVVNTWPRAKGSTRLVFLGDEVGEQVKTGVRLMRSGPPGDPVRAAYEAYLGGCGCVNDGAGARDSGGGRESWDPLTVLYAMEVVEEGAGVGGSLFEMGNAYGYNVVDAVNGSNRWIWDESVTNQFFLRLQVANETAAAAVERRMLDGAWRCAAARAKATAGAVRLSDAKDEL